MTELEDENRMKLVKGIMSPKPDRMKTVRERGYAFAVEYPYINRMELIDERYASEEALEALFNTEFIEFVILSWD